MKPPKSEGPGRRRRPAAREKTPLALVVTLLALAAQSGAGAQAAPRRDAVLKQVKVPHAYYWREMYVPQVTSGPAALTWSPDGREVIYAMQGTLWRQRLGTTEATQLTDGPGYDHQPDWSGDGRSVVYTSYRDDALELRVLDLTTGDDRALVRDGAVNLDPRWSPDGGRIAFVSTAHEGRWHVFVAPVARDGGALRLAAAPARITADSNAGLPRYYYSQWDHYLSPAWSPDGRELVLVSNRGRVWGSGGFWRMEARAGAPMRELHYEETTWKGRPNWSPDGKRVVYSSYHGRQWNQLWLTTAAPGGDPFQLTYGEFDATAPRWSPDGRRIAYIANEGGNTELRVVDVPGGRTERVAARTRRYRRPVGRLLVTVIDSATGRALAARVAVAGPDGRAYAPDDAWRHADEAFVRGEQRFEHSYFHVGEGDSAAVTVPAGEVTVEAWRGPEFRVVRQTVTVTAGQDHPLRLALPRLADLPARGWWGGDLHVHMNYGGAYRNTPARLAQQGRAEGLHLVENLIVNKEQRIPDIAYFRGAPDPVSTGDFVLAHGQELHTSFWGHTALLGMREHYILPDYAGYANTAAASLAPMNAEMHDLARAQGGVTGYVHPFDFAPDLARFQSGVPWELPVDVALGKVDYLEVMGFSDHLVTSDVWYRLLNCGFRVPAAAGTDAFPNFASLRGPPGLVRVYAAAGPALDHGRFLEAVRGGRTFVTNAPLLELEVEGRGPGDEVRLPAGRRARPLRVRVALRSAVPVDHLELVERGRVVASVPLRGGRTSADTTLTVATSRSGWLVLRARADRPRLPVLDLYPFASTSPVYVQVGDEPVRSAQDAAYFVAWIDRLRPVVAASDAWNTPAERDATLATLAKARGEFERRGVGGQAAGDTPR